MEHDAPSVRFVSFSELVNLSAAKFQRQECEIEDWLGRRAKIYGLPLPGVCVHRPGVGTEIVGGERAYGLEAIGSKLLDTAELWPLLVAKFGPPGSGQLSRGARLPEQSAREGDAPSSGSAPEVIEVSKPPSIGAENECCERLAELMTASPDCATMTNAALQEEMMMSISRLSVRGFKRAKAEAIKQTGATAWRNAGRKSYPKSEH